MDMLAADPPVDLQVTSPGTAQTGHLNITGTATVGLLKSQGTVFGASTAPTGFAYGGYFTAASNQGRGFYGFASSPTGLTYGGFFQNASESGRAVYGLATSTTGFNYGGYFQTASSGGRGLLGVAASPTGTTYGVYGTAVSPDGFGVYSDGKMHATGVISGNGSGLTSVDASKLGGKSAGQYYSVGNAIAVDGSFYSAVRAVSQYPGGRGLYALATDNAATTHGVWAEVSSPTGRGVLGYAFSTTGVNRGVYGRSDSNEGTGVWGLAYSTTGNTRGVYAEAASTSGRAVEAYAPANSGSTFGVRATNLSPSGRAVAGYANATTGNPMGVLGEAKAPDGAGVFASNTSASGYAYGLLGSSNASPSAIGTFGQALHASGVTYGVYGRADSPNGYGLYTSGRFAAGGTKAFRIDHPLDPTGKYLMHYCTESPTPQNSYSGSIVTDGTGRAWVQLPDYFAEINANFKYQLTVVQDDESSQFVQVKVARRIQGNRFLIMSSAPNIEVSWRIEADRNDGFVRTHGAPTEVEKVGIEAGTYQHPEFFGASEERGIHAKMKTAPPKGSAKGSKTP
jgi:hypothetical protein